MKKRIEILMSKDCSLKLEPINVDYKFDIDGYEKKVDTFFENAEYIFKESPSQTSHENPYYTMNLRLYVNPNGVVNFHLQQTDTIVKEIEVEVSSAISAEEIQTLQEEEWDKLSLREKVSLYETYFRNRVKDIKERLAFLNKMVKE